MAKMKSDVVYLKDLVKRLDGATLRDVAGLGLKIQGWEWCNMGRASCSVSVWLWKEV